ncbi:hypothetical protein [Cryobacterium sp.]|jgi:phosphotransferase system  glucose/maltose/N-acetylglucosamine-specific IIC component|uniref:hypothetical protein n=1 Tax=Cryobacterium sp. TaxID=1926290 RepID=UPI00260A7FCB|nr:hypothetical protein [Cryobacterium sp.]MCU1445323.1 N-acetylglucosamine transporter subunit [Cryobacterium sp.]
MSSATVDAGTGRKIPGLAQLQRVGKPLLLIPIGLACAAIHYFLVRFVIRRWNLKTPGRGDDDVLEGGNPDSASTTF